jgi:DNA (cytosine-5)-methyltransferase 1
VSLHLASFFSGVGGIDCAFHRAGVPTLLTCEIDAAATSVLRRHFPDAVHHRDITEVTADDLHAAGCIPERTVLVGGFPCQDLSVAGARRGMGQGTRSGLYWHLDRLMADFRPAWVVLENVPGLLSSHGGRDMGAVVGSLADRGYGWAYRVLDAQHAGVPQRRRRVVIVGHLGAPWAAPAEVLLEPDSGGRSAAPRVTPRAVSAADAGRGAGGGVAPTLTAHHGRLTGTDEALIVGALTSSQGGPDDNDAQAGHLVVSTLGDVTHTLTAEGHDASEDGTGRGTPIIAATLTAGTSSPGVSAPGRRHEDDTNLVVGTFQKIIRPATAEHPDVWAPRDVAATLSPFDLGSDSRAVELVATETTVRRLTPLECERLQGFPDGWTAGQADSPRYRQMGNAVAVPVFEWVARRLVAVDADMRAGAA